MVESQLNQDPRPEDSKPSKPSSVRDRLNLLWLLSMFMVVVWTGGERVALAQPSGGPVLIGGDDAEEHGSFSGGVNMLGWLYTERGFDLIGPEVQNAQSAAVCLGCNTGAALSMFQSAFDHSNLPALGWSRAVLTSTAALNAFFDGTGTVNIGTAGIIYMPSVASEVTGGITTAQLAVVNANAGRLNNFVGAGGGLFTHTQNGTSGGWGWLTTLLPGITTNSASGCNERILHLTPEGMVAFPDLTDQILSGATPWHTWFGDNLGGLEVLVTGPCGMINRPVIIGGRNVQIRRFITLSPTNSTGLTCSAHVLTATVTNLAGNPVSNSTVAFQVLSGPNSGRSGTGVTNTSWVATFTYLGTRGSGLDTIRASFFDGQVTQFSTPVEHQWVGPAFADCNTNSVSDECDIASGTSLDDNDNGVPDECECSTITSSPAPRIACPTGTATFSVGTTGPGGRTFRWEVLPAGSSTWLPLGNGPFPDVGTISGAGLSMLTVDRTGHPFYPSGPSFRCIVNTPCGSQSSDSATLTICPANFNCDGFVNSQDFFDFLPYFFSGNADFNRDGVTNSQDFYDFVTAFFAGCP